MLESLRKRKGFTLIELIVVIAILGILAAVLIPRFTGFQERARRTQALVDAKQIATAIDTYQIENNAWPANTAANVDAIRDIAGVDDGSITIGSDGAFTYWTEAAGDGYDAGRTSASGVPGPVEAPSPGPTYTAPTA